MKISPNALALDLSDDLEPTYAHEADDEEPRRGRRDGWDPSRLGLHAASLLVGCIVGVGAGALTRSLLAWTPLAGLISPVSLGAVGGLVGLSICLAYSHLMAEAREGTLKVKVDGERRSFPLRRRHEVVRRATAYLVGGLGGLTMVLAGGAYLYGSTHGIASLTRFTPGPEAGALGLVAVAAMLTLALGEGIFRMTQRQDRVDHAPSLLLPAMIGFGAALARLV